MTTNGMLRIKRQYSIVAHSPDVVELRHGVWNPISHTLTDESDPAIWSTSSPASMVRTRPPRSQARRECLARKSSRCSTI